jgi:hypothetical protein
MFDLVIVFKVSSPRIYVCVAYGRHSSPPPKGGGSMGPDRLRSRYTLINPLTYLIDVSEVQYQFYLSVLNNEYILRVHPEKQME